MASTNRIIVDSVGSVKNPAKDQEFLILEIQDFPNGDADPDRYRLGSATQARESEESAEVS